MTILGDQFEVGIPNGWVPLGWQTLCAFGPDCKAGGSCTGSAVALAVGMTAAAIGAETMGSIVSTVSIPHKSAVSDRRRPQLSATGCGV
jgi:hypothetical protein